MIYLYLRRIEIEWELINKNQYLMIYENILPAFASNIEFAWKNCWLKIWNHSSLIIGICEVIAVLGSTRLSRAQLIFLYFIYLIVLFVIIKGIFFSYRPFIRPKIGKLHEASGMVCNIQWLILLYNITIIKWNYF